jgi:hypothetical protein
VTEIGSIPGNWLNGDERIGPGDVLATEADDSERTDPK